MPITLMPLARFWKWAELGAMVWLAGARSGASLFPLCFECALLRFQRVWKNSSANKPSVLMAWLPYVQNLIFVFTGHVPLTVLPMRL